MRNLRYITSIEIGYVLCVSVGSGENRLRRLYPVRDPQSQKSQPINALQHREASENILGINGHPSNKKGNKSLIIRDIYCGFKK